MLHRLPEQHECLFDHLGRGRQEAVLKMVKLDRKVGRSCQRIGEECSWATFPPFPRISVFRQCLSTNRDYIIFFFLLSFLFFQDFSRIFWIQTSTSFLFKLCLLLFWGGGDPTVTPIVFCFCWLDHIPAAKMPFGEKRKYRISSLICELLATHKWAE